MSRALSLDLCVRVLAAVAAGLSHRAAAARFGVSAASIGRWCPRARLEDDPGPSATGGDRGSGRIEAHLGLVLELVAQTPGITIEELRRLLAGRWLGFGYGTVQRFLVRHGMTRKKKIGHASEQDCPEVVARRQAWRDSQAGLDLARREFINGEADRGRRPRKRPNGPKTNMARTYGPWKAATS